MNGVIILEPRYYVSYIQKGDGGTYCERLRRVMIENGETITLFPTVAGALKRTGELLPYACGVRTHTL